MHDKEDTSLNSSGSDSKTTKTATIQEESDSIEEVQSSSPSEQQKIHSNTRYYLKGIGFLILLLVTTTIISMTYTFLHGIRIIELFTQPQAIWSFNFVGGSANPASIGIEIWTWTLIGVNCRLAYISSQAIIRGKFDILKYLVKWISTSLFSWGIAVAVIFSFQVVALNLGGIEITLANASIETIIAISFILGFYYDEARKLLGNLRGQIVAGAESKTEQEEEGNT